MYKTYDMKIIFFFILIIGGHFALCSASLQIIPKLNNRLVKKTESKEIISWKILTTTSSPFRYVDGRETFKYFYSLTAEDQPILIYKFVNNNISSLFLNLNTFFNKVRLM